MHNKASQRDQKNAASLWFFGPAGGVILLRIYKFMKAIIILIMLLSIASCSSNKIKFIEFVGVDPNTLCDSYGVLRPIQKGWFFATFDEKNHKGVDYSRGVAGPVHDVMGLSLIHI